MEFAAGVSDCVLPSPRPRQLPRPNLKVQAVAKQATRETAVRRRGALRRPCLSGARGAVSRSAVAGQQQPLGPLLYLLAWQPRSTSLRRTTCSATR